MTRRRWIPWVVFGLCALLVVDVLGWATWRVLGLERAERLASARADAGRRERLALWQMDSLVSAIIARESARPYFVYRARYAADMPYDRAWDVGASADVQASPLAGGTGDPLIRLHYQLSRTGAGKALQSVGAQGDAGAVVTSPQAGGEPGAVAVSPGVLRAGRLLRELTTNAALEEGSDGGEPAVKAAGRDRLLRMPLDDAAEAVEPAADAVAGQAPAQIAAAESEAEPQAERAAAEVDPERADADLRRQLFDIARQGPGFRYEQGETVGVQVGVFRPRWLPPTDPGEGDGPGAEPELVFERTVLVGDEAYTQGLWIDWPSLRAELLAAAVRLVPGAELRPAVAFAGDPGLGSAGGPGLLATIPLRLVTPDPAAALPTWTPTRVTLAVTWVAALTALTAIGLVLRAATRLADRRGRFVTAVTHELRSPLTSFRLYADLLHAGGDDPAARARYTDALRRESARLAAVVESVLAYAGLTRARPDAREERLGDLLEPLLPSLRERVERAGGVLRAEVEPGAADAVVRVAPGSLERILSNLVDNAARYGVDAESPAAEVVLSARRAGPVVRLRVADGGPGVPARDRDRIFQPFSRGRNNKPGDDRGVGLGLALARGLARAEGGDLRLLRTQGPGAAFELTLPAAGAGSERVERVGGGGGV